MPSLAKGPAAQLAPERSAKPPIGKRLEAWWRGVRCYVDPRRHANYLRVLRDHGAPTGDRPIAWCDFRSTEIDTIGGSHVFQLTHELLSAGYQPVFRRNFRFLASLHTKPYKRLLLDEPFGAGLDEPGQTAITITDDPQAAAASRARHVALIDYAPRRPRSGEVAVPYCMSPCVTIAGPPPEIDAALPRPVGVFFAGSTGSHDYDRAVIRERYGMMTRQEVIDHLLSASSVPAPLRLREQRDAERLLDAPPIALSIDGGCRIEHREWLPTLALADFWLACPGTQMPMCHNLIEALSVGCVPILEYDQHTTPTLQDGVNCLSFRGRDGLVQAIRRALSMPQARRAEMRAAARDFYVRHHAPGALVQRVTGAGSRRTTLLLNEHLAPRREAIDPARRAA